MGFEDILTTAPANQPLTVDYNEYKGFRKYLNLPFGFKLEDEIRKATFTVHVSTRHDHDAEWGGASEAWYRSLARYSASDFDDVLPLGPAACSEHRQVVHQLRSLGKSPVFHVPTGPSCTVTLLY